MSPASNNHGMLQGALAGALWNKYPDSRVITECSVQTSDGVKVADVAWASAALLTSSCSTSSNSFFRLNVRT